MAPEPRINDSWRPVLTWQRAQQGHAADHSSERELDEDLDDVLDRLAVRLG